MLLLGKAVCITGKLSTMTRAEAQNRIKDKGGIFVNDATLADFLVVGAYRNPSSKLLNAKAVGTPLIDEIAFLEMLNPQKSQQEIWLQRYFMKLALVINPSFVSKLLDTWKDSATIFVEFIRVVPVEKLRKIPEFRTATDHHLYEFKTQIVDVAKEILEKKQ